MKASLKLLAAIWILTVGLVFHPSILEAAPAGTLTWQEEKGAGSGEEGGAGQTDQEQREADEGDDEDGDTSRRRNRRRRSDSYSKRSKEFISIFENVTASAAASTVRITDGSKDLALGAIVDSDGFVLTKASELKGNLQVEMTDGSSFSAEVFGIDPDTDLALLRVDGKELPTIQWSEEPSPSVGQWVATPNGRGATLAVGIVSVDVRRIPSGGGFMGILPANPSNGQGVRISSVTPDKPAARAGLLVNDVILKIDDEEIANVPKLREVLRNYSEGDEIKLTIKRGDEELLVPLRLSDPRKDNEQYMEMMRRSNIQNAMGSTLSRRRLDFPKAFQHDSQLQAVDCGGPIVDLDGRVVGLNIARAGRVKSFALPVEVIVPIVQQLKTGRYRPEIVNSERISEVKERLEAVAAKIAELPSKRDAIQKTLTADQARQEELERMRRDLTARIEALAESNQNNRDELDSIEQALEDAESSRQQLERELEQLQSGKKD